MSKIKADHNQMHDPEVQHYHVKMTDGWLPLPDDLLTILGWKEGDDLEVVAIYGNQLIVRKKGALRDG